MARGHVAIVIPPASRCFAGSGLHRDTGVARIRGSGVGRGGARAVFAFPVQFSGIRLGALNLYRDTSGVLGASNLTEALAFVDAAFSVFVESQTPAPPGQLQIQVSDLLSVHSKVHQATGMIAVQMRVSLADALLLLRARAYADERSIDDVAQDFVTRVTRFD